VDDAGMSAGPFRTSAERPSSIGLQFRVLEDFALHKLWLEPVDGVWEPQGPERRRFLPALQHPQAGLDLADHLVLYFDGLCWVPGLPSSSLVSSESLKSSEARRSFHSWVVQMEAPKSLAEARRFG
jgi:hypothetical protein